MEISFWIKRIYLQENSLEIIPIHWMKNLISNSWLCLLIRGFTADKIITDTDGKIFRIIDLTPRIRIKLLSVVNSQYVYGWDRHPWKWFQWASLGKTPSTGKTHSDTFYLGGNFYSKICKICTIFETFANICDICEYLRIFTTFANICNICEHLKIQNKFEYLFSDTIP